MPFYLIGGFFIPQARAVAIGQQIEDENCDGCTIPGLPRQFDPTKECDIFDAGLNLALNHGTHDPQMSFCMLTAPAARKPNHMWLDDTVLPDGSLNWLATVFVQRWHGPDQWPTPMPDLEQYQQDEITDISKKQLEDLGLSDLEFITTVVNRPEGWTYERPPLPAAFYS
ncbi:hypothetical protein FIBSPDRAFT_1043396 [Athelia psychrophila]|uniref:Uncharacterized protein n=1 Tax=Athelia psychrophila TaxID=1759441 RepID=A0A166LCS0_9AGAM|nr:hypothetical protein FIBSPDRAFT_1043396 [Fibularhizoctonia sp. CBS 109695]